MLVKNFASEIFDRFDHSLCRIEDMLNGGKGLNWTICGLIRENMVNLFIKIGTISNYIVWLDFKTNCGSASEIIGLIREQLKQLGECEVDGIVSNNNFPGRPENAGKYYTREISSLIVQLEWAINDIIRNF